MYFRRFSVAIASSLVAYGAWYAYKGQTADGVGSVTSAAQQTRALSSATSHEGISPTTGPQQERKAVIVTADSIYTGSIEGDEPISKYTGDTGRKVLEMLTPEQATAKLRKNEESYFVNRGQGVVRYDVVQIASNNPIEDDHSEKIVEVPETDNTSDWMFWGIYDG